MAMEIPHFVKHDLPIWTGFPTFDHQRVYWKSTKFHLPTDPSTAFRRDSHSQPMTNQHLRRLGFSGRRSQPELRQKGMLHKCMSLDIPPNIITLLDDNIIYIYTLKGDMNHIHIHIHYYTLSYTIKYMTECIYLNYKRNTKEQIKKERAWQKKEHAPQLQTSHSNSPGRRGCPELHCRRPSSSRLGLHCSPSPGELWHHGSSPFKEMGRTCSFGWFCFFFGKFRDVFGVFIVFSLAEQPIF